MNKIICPKCKSDKVEWVDIKNEEVDLETDSGYTDVICECVDCNTNFSLWIDFDISNIKIKLEEIWNESEE